MSFLYPFSPLPQMVQLEIFLLMCTQRKFQERFCNCFYLIIGLIMEMLIRYWNLSVKIVLMERINSHEYRLDWPHIGQVQHQRQLKQWMLFSNSISKYDCYWFLPAFTMISPCAWIHQFSIILNLCLGDQEREILIIIFFVLHLIVWCLDNVKYRISCHFDSACMPINLSDTVLIHRHQTYPFASETTCLSRWTL